jgi:hypothetical protein
MLKVFQPPSTWTVRRSTPAMTRREANVWRFECHVRLGFEPEVTAGVARARCRVFEVPISYSGRTYSEGKKITWKDGARGLWCTVRYNVFR